MVVIVKVTKKKKNPWYEYHITRNENDIDHPFASDENGLEWVPQFQF